MFTMHACPPIHRFLYLDLTLDTILNFCCELVQQREERLHFVGDWKRSFLLQSAKKKERGREIILQGKRGEKTCY